MHRPHHAQTTPCTGHKTMTYVLMSPTHHFRLNRVVSWMTSSHFLWYVATSILFAECIPIQHVRGFNAAILLWQMEYHAICVHALPNEHVHGILVWEMQFHALCVLALGNEHVHGKYRNCCMPPHTDTPIFATNNTYSAFWEPHEQLQQMAFAEWDCW